jgi:hypothetical protein
MATPNKILDLPMDPNTNDAEASSIREYVIALLTLLIEQGEDMVKKPFGNSGWQYEFFIPLLKAGLIEGEFDEDGYVESLDIREAEALILEAIKTL